MQSDGNSFFWRCVFDTFNNVSRDEDNIFDQMYKKQICQICKYDNIIRK